MSALSNYGNKRTAAIAMLVFLDLNAFDFAQTDDQVAEVFERLARSEVDQRKFFAWVRAHTQRTG